MNEFKLNDYTFSKLSEVDDYLMNDEYEIPSRTAGRQTFHTEYYTLKYLLREIKTEAFTEFPVILKHDDKPDFKIISKNHAIGIEVTESIPEQLARASALLEKLYPECVILEPDFFGWDAPERTNDEIIEIIKKSNQKLIGKGFVGKSLEINWVNGIIGCIRNKVVKLNKPDFNKLNRNWLIIYDNQVRIFMEYEYVGELLCKELKNKFKNEGSYSFDRIFIISGKKIISLSFDRELTINFIERK